jgi:hypothetical protein
LRCQNKIENHSRTNIHLRGEKSFLFEEERKRERKKLMVRLPTHLAAGWMTFFGDNGNRKTDLCNQRWMGIKAEKGFSVYIVTGKIFILRYETGFFVLFSCEYYLFSSVHLWILIELQIMQTILLLLIKQKKWSIFYIYCC